MLSGLEAPACKWAEMKTNLKMYWAGRKHPSSSYCCLWMFFFIRQIGMAIVCLFAFLKRPWLLFGNTNNLQKFVCWNIYFLNHWLCIFDHFVSFAGILCLIRLMISLKNVIDKSYEFELVIFIYWYITTVSQMLWIYY